MSHATTRSHAHHTSTTVLGGDALARARDLMKPRAGCTKAELQRDGYTRERRSGRGTKAVHYEELVRSRLRLLLGELLEAHDELQRLGPQLSSDLPRTEWRERRATVRDRIGVVERGCRELLDEAPTEREERAARDVYPRNLDECAGAPVGAVLYAGRESVRPAHIAELRAAVQRRGLVLAEVAPFYFEIQVPAAPPPRRACSACGYERTHRDGRCVRCGTQTRAA